MWSTRWDGNWNRNLIVLSGLILITTYKNLLRTYYIQIIVLVSQREVNQSLPLGSLSFFYGKVTHQCDYTKANTELRSKVDTV